MQAIENEIRKSVDDAMKAAKNDKEIPLSELTADIYATCLEKEIRNVHPFSPLSHARLGPAINA